MLLNLLRVEQLRIEDMLQRSYVECAALRQGAARKDQLQQVSNIKSCLTIESETNRYLVANIFTIE